MSIKTVAVIVLLCCTVSRMEAQAVSKPADPVFVRAQAMVSDGNGVAGRALIDSVIAATPPMAPLYPQALFWRASLAASAADAESDYKHIVVDYPLAPQAADALLRLAQLELARGDRDGALAHLQRIPRDYPRSKSLARASYWTARVLFEKNDIPHACAANESALSQADTTEIELRNQIQYQGQRCPAVAVASSAGSVTPPTAISVSPPGVSSPAVSASSAPATVPTTAAAVAPATAAPASPAVPAPVQSKAEIPAKVLTPPSRPQPMEANDSKPSIVDPSKAPKATLGSGGYSVQVAAYNHRADADKLVATLKGRGYAARVDGNVTPFRVRIGRYATENDAEDALKRLKAKRMDGFVVKAPQL
ncbi:MAG TPA: SPOR domain-containing protein [Gemmatimonadaceae bacterium]